MPFRSLVFECRPLCVGNPHIHPFSSPPTFAPSAARFVQLIRDTSDAGVEPHQLYRTLGVNAVFCPPPEEARRSILNEVKHNLIFSPSLFYSMFYFCA